MLKPHPQFSGSAMFSMVRVFICERNLKNLRKR
jgi:hypothetical protein